MPPVSQDVSDFCASIAPAVQNYTQAQVDAAVTTATAAAETANQAAIDSAVADAKAQVAAQLNQDHADEIAALKDALAKATAPI